VLASKSSQDESTKPEQGTIAAMPRPPYSFAYEAGSAKNRPRAGSAGARSEGRARGAGAVYVASNALFESVIGGGDGALVAAAPLCARSRAFVLYRAKRQYSPCSFLELLDQQPANIT